MSVTSGYFLGAGKHMVYIAGAPRSNLTGEVFLFRKQVDGKNRTLELLGQLGGMLRCKINCKPCRVKNNTEYDTVFHLSTTELSIICSHNYNHVAPFSIIA